LRDEVVREEAEYREAEVIVDNVAASDQIAIATSSPLFIPKS
jgi:hypothetical protein